MSHDLQPPQQDPATMPLGEGWTTHQGYSCNPTCTSYRGHWGYKAIALETKNFRWVTELLLFTDSSICMRHCLIWVATGKHFFMSPELLSVFSVDGEGPLRVCGCLWNASHDQDLERYMQTGFKCTGLRHPTGLFNIWTLADIFVSLMRNANSHQRHIL